jgi:hypothetical protein
MNIEEYFGHFLKKEFPCWFKIARFCYQYPFIIASRFNSRNYVSYQQVTDGDREHFFGYYDKSPWDCAGENILCLSAPFTDRHPTASNPAQILLIELSSNMKHVIGETHAWNLQQGCRLQWLGPDFQRKIVYNDFRDSHYVSVVHDIGNQDQRIIDMPIYDLTPDGKTALSLNYERIHMYRPGYGYNRHQDAAVFEAFPETDGIWNIDMTTGSNRLIISFAQFAHDLNLHHEQVSETRFKHMMINPSGTRFMFLYRRREGDVELTNLYTSNMDGTSVYCLATDEMVSHATWKNDYEILAWVGRKDAGNHFYLFRDLSDYVTIVGKDILTEDGHPSFSSGNKYILLDTYANRARMRSLYLFNMGKETIHMLGQFYSPFRYAGEFRCDLHPRWKVDGSQVCFDSVHEGKRQIYIADTTQFSN